jgi:hypothetical protein
MTKQNKIYLEADGDDIKKDEDLYAFYVACDLHEIKDTLERIGAPKHLIKTVRFCIKENEYYMRSDWTEAFRLGRPHESCSH